MMVPMQSDYHRRFHEQARQYLDPSVFHDIHVKARGSTGGAAPRTPKGQERQPEDEDAPTPLPPAEARVRLGGNKEPVQKSALDAISGMWSRTLDALTGRQNVNKSGIEDGLSAFYGAGTQRPPLKNTQAKKKKRVTKSALMTLADAVAEHDGLEPDGIVAIQLAAEHGRTLGAIGLGYIAQDKATIAHDLDTGRLPFEDASVNQVYVRKSAVDDGLDLDAMLPELRRVCAPGARIYSDFGLTTVNKSGEWDEDAHPRSDNGEFGSGGKAAANSSASHARNRTAQKLAEHSVERMKALKKRINKSAVASWDENAHPRADNGEFGTGSGISKNKTPGDLVKEAQAHTAAANGLRASASKASGLNKTALLKQAAAHDKQSTAKIKESRALQKQRKAAGTTASASEPAKKTKPKRAPAAKKAEKQQPEAKKETHEETTSAEPTNHAETAKIDAKKLTGDQHESLKTYQSPEFARMNGLARGQSAETDYLNSKEKAAYHAQIAHLDSAINNSKLTEPTTVYRGVKMPPSFTKQLKPGAQFSDGGFQSTSSDHEKADEFAGHKGMVLHINVPSGAHALRVSDHLSSRENTNKSEKEIILPRNTQYRVTKVVRANGIVKEVHVDVVGG